jgi:hypothetical protein
MLWSVADVDKQALADGDRQRQPSTQLGHWVPGRLVRLRPTQELQRPVGCNSDQYEFMLHYQPGPPQSLGSGG